MLWRLLVAAVGEHAVNEVGNAVAHIAFHRFFRQIGQTEMAAGGVGGGGQICDGIAKRAVQIKGNGLNVFDSGCGHGFISKRLQEVGIITLLGSKKRLPGKAGKRLVLQKFSRMGFQTGICLLVPYLNIQNNKEINAPIIIGNNHSKRVASDGKNSKPSGCLRIRLAK